MPSPQPSPTGEGAGCSRSRRCRPSEKECLKYQRQDFFRQPLSQGRWNTRRERFFRRPLNPSVECVPQGTHAVGWGCRENRERVRAYRTHPTMQAKAYSPQPSPTGEGANCSRFRRYRSSEKRMPEISTAGIFQVAFIARQMEQTPRAFFQTAFESISGACAARHARGGFGLQGKWRTRACVPHISYMRVTACLLLLKENENVRKYKN